MIILPCTAPKATPHTRNTVSTDDDNLRKAAARQLLSTHPNFINRGDKIKANVVWADGGIDQFTHTTFAGWTGPAVVKAGDGVNRCNASA
jgi:hypothetical protein